MKLPFIRWVGDSVVRQLVRETTREGLPIEEHGLHIWLGFYENAFEVMNRCYAELKRPPEHPIATVGDAFKPHSFVVLEEQLDTGWKNWCSDFPTNRVASREWLEAPDYLGLPSRWRQSGCTTL